MAVRSARRPSTRSIASRYSGLARIERGDGLAAAKRRSRTAALASVRRGRVGQHPAVVDDEARAADRRCRRRCA